MGFHRIANAPITIVVIPAGKSTFHIPCDTSLFYQPFQSIQRNLLLAQTGGQFCRPYGWSCRFFANSFSKAERAKKCLQLFSFFVLLPSGFHGKAILYHP